jgi:hypothetical protein
MSCGRNGQPFRDTFHDTKEDSLQKFNDHIHNGNSFQFLYLPFSYIILPTVTHQRGTVTNVDFIQKKDLTSSNA